jgi:mycothiol synthase
VIRDGSAADLAPLTNLLARANEAPYDIRTVAEEKLFGEGYSGAPRVRVYGNFAGVAVTCGKYLRLIAVEPEQRRGGIGSALLEDSGAAVIGAEPGNYFTPGVVSTDAASIAFFGKYGFRETATTQNLECLSIRVLEYSSSRVRTGGGAAVLNFIEHYFGAIWRFEASHAQTIFHIVEDGEIAGFATHEANNRGLGFFGPTGVAEQFRGRGLGRELLLASLADLQRRGFDRVIIPWTDAIAFYRKSCGARVAHRFTILRRIAP